MSTEEQIGTKVWLYPFVLLAGGALLLFVVLLSFDTHLFTSFNNVSKALFSANLADVQNALGNLPEVVVAVLGIAITVVSIILQLSATRYTPRVTEMFFRDRTNLLVLSIFVITSIHCIWVTFAVHHNFFPPILVISTIVLMTAVVLILIPYFAYVFAFLDPERVVKRLEEQAVKKAVRSRTKIPRSVRQGHVLSNIEQLADIAVNAISQKDRTIASRSVDALKDLVTSYLDNKVSLDDKWFRAGRELLRNPDFLVMAQEHLQKLEADHVWLEWKILRQYQAIFNDAINRMRDIGQLIAINTRYIGEEALKHRDDKILGLSLKFFNTYLRAALNNRDVRTAYNVLHQYRQLAEAILRKGSGDEIVDVVGYFRYYGQTANQLGLSFITETAANDLCQLCEAAYQVNFKDQKRLLDTFLDVDKVPENEEEDRALRGVRKAQIKLATYYLDMGADELARYIFEDMESERSERLQSIREEMLSVIERDFWEVSDRGVNFDYLEPSRREHLNTFYSWFKQV